MARVSVDNATICAEYGDGSIDARRSGSGRGPVAAGTSIRRVWLEPTPTIHPAVATAIAGFDAVIIGPGSFYTSIMPPLLVQGVAEALAQVRGPIILIANLLTEGRGMSGFTAGDAVRRVADALSRPVDVVIVNTVAPAAGGPGSLSGRAQGAAAPRARARRLRSRGSAALATSGIARHDRRRLPYAVWTVLARRML